MSQKRLWLITTNGDRAKAQPMIDSTAMCAKFLDMPLAGVLWGKGGGGGGGEGGWGWRRFCRTDDWFAILRR
jgi:hypothetical protein